jgi:uncharacterized protein (TIGR03083 family)
MTRAAIDALRSEREAVLGVCRSLSADEWVAPSDCAGWSVQDVIAHMASIYHPTLSLLKAFRPNSGAEDGNEVLVAERRGWSHERQLAEYETWTGRALHLLGLLQREPIARARIPLADLGSYPAHWMANAAFFDHYTHLRVDILAPIGPIDRPRPEPDPPQLEPAIAWMLLVLPHLARESLAWLDDPVQLRLVGPGGGVWTIRRPSTNGGLRVVPSESPGAAVTIVSTTPEFVIWATKRRGWQTRDVEITGDEKVAERFLDAVHIV